MKKLINIILLICVCFTLQSQLPYSFSWESRHSNSYISSAKDQEVQGPCGVFAAVAAVEAMSQIYYNNPGAGLFNFSVSEVYNNNCSGIGCESATPEDALDFAVSPGLIENNCFPYPESWFNIDTCIDCDTRCGSPSQHIYVPDINDWEIDLEEEDDLKQAIIDYGPIIMMPDLPNACALHSGVDCNISHTVLFLGWDGSQWQIKDSWPGSPSISYKTYSPFSYQPHFYRVYPVNPNNSNDSLRCSGSQAELFSRKGWDKDVDGFYSWGLESYGRPANCPGPNLPDWDDSDPDNIYRSGDTIYSTPTISGTSGKVCQSGGNPSGYPFALSYVPPRFSCSWYISKNANCFNTYQGDGSSVTIYPNSTCTGKESEITFRITQNGDGGYAEYKQSFYVNCPSEDLMSYYVLDSYGSSPPKYGDTYYLCPYTYYTIYFNENDPTCVVTGLEWNLPYGWSKNYEYSNYVSIYTNDVPDGFLEIKGYTTCSPSTKAILLNPYFGAAECGGDFLAYPNPAENFVDIDFNKNKFNAEKIIIEDECLLTIVDKSGMIKFKSEFKVFPYRINTSNLLDGLYFVNILFNGKTSTVRLVIKH